MYRIILLALLVLCFSPFSMAETSTHRQAAEEVLLLMKVDEMMKPFIRNFQQTQLRNFQQSNMPPGAMDIVKKYLQQMTEIIVRETEWSKTKDDFIDIYTNVYDEEELKQLIAFYNSPLGKKMVEKMPFLGQQSMQLAQKFMKQAGPEIQKLTTEMINELKEKYPTQ